VRGCRHAFRAFVLLRRAASLRSSRCRAAAFSLEIEHITPATTRTTPTTSRRTVARSRASPRKRSGATSKSLQTPSDLLGLGQPEDGDVVLTHRGAEAAHHRLAGALLVPDVAHVELRGRRDAVHLKHLPLDRDASRAGAAVHRGHHVIAACERPAPNLGVAEGAAFVGYAQRVRQAVVGVGRRFGRELVAVAVGVVVDGGDEGALPDQVLLRINSSDYFRNQQQGSIYRKYLADEVLGRIHVPHLLVVVVLAVAGGARRLVGARLQNDCGAMVSSRDRIYFRNSQPGAAGSIYGIYLQDEVGVTVGRGGRRPLVLVVRRAEQSRGVHGQRHVRLDVVPMRRESLQDQQRRLLKESTARDPHVHAGGRVHAFPESPLLRRIRRAARHQYHRRARLRVRGAAHVGFVGGHGEASAGGQVLDRVGSADAPAADNAPLAVVGGGHCAAVERAARVGALRRGVARGEADKPRQRLAVDGELLHVWTGVRSTRRQAHKYAANEQNCRSSRRPAL